MRNIFRISTHQFDHPPVNGVSVCNPPVKGGLRGVLFGSPPKIGGVRGGIPVSQMIKQHTPPSLPSLRRGVQTSVKLSSCKTVKLGFTLVELMIVIAIIGVLSATLFPMISGYMAKARDTARQTNMRQILTALQMFGNDHENAVPKGCNLSVTFPNNECDWGRWDTSGSGLFMPFLQDYMAKIPVDPINDNKSGPDTQQYFYYCFQNNPGYITGVTLAWRSESSGLWYSALDKTSSGTTPNNLASNNFGIDGNQKVYILCMP